MSKPAWITVFGLTVALLVAIVSRRSQAAFDQTVVHHQAITPASPYGVGRVASPSEVAARDITVFPTGAGLPAGQGSAVEGARVYQSQCAVCHGDRGLGRDDGMPALVGGIGSLTSKDPKLTVGSYWPYATTLFDYTHRAMPYQSPGSLSADDTYAVTAYVLFLNGIVGEREVLDARALPLVRMPNRDGFVNDPRPDLPSRPPSRRY